MANTLKVTLVKSPIGAVPKHKKTVAAMGLTKTVDFPIPPFPYTAILINPVFPLLPE